MYKKAKQAILKRFSTFHAKLSLAFVCTSLFPFLLSVFVAMSTINLYMVQDKKHTFYTNANLEAQQLEAKLDLIINLQNSLSSYVPSMLSRKSGGQREISSESLSRFQALRTTITNLEYIYDVDKIRIYSDNIPFTSGDSFCFFPLEELEPSVFQKVTASASKLKHLNVLRRQPDLPIISFYQVLKNIYGEVRAISFIDLNLDETMLHLFPSAEDRLSLAVVYEDELLYNDIPDVSSLSDLTGTSNGRSTANKIYTVSPSKYQLRKNSAYANWFYVFQSSPQNLQSMNHILLMGYGVVFLFALILCIFTINILPNALSRKISHFSQAINQIPNETLACAETTEQILRNLTANTAHKDEIDAIICSFEKLFQKNRQLSTKIQTHQLEIERSKFAILQEQINPHFLYNSLDTIRICVLIDKKQSASDLITALSQFYRISLSKGRDVISIKEELNMVLSYLQIEYIGYDKHISWDISCAPEVMDYDIPKFTMQPIIENSIVHCDFSDPDFQLHISIRITLSQSESQDVSIEISDNGPGLSPARLQEINQLLSHTSSHSTQSYGLQNCCQRIRLYYGADYGLFLKEVPAGCCTCIRFPGVSPSAV